MVTEAENNPVLATDPAWHQIHARGLSQRGQFAQLPGRDRRRPQARALDKGFVLWDEYVNLLVRAKDWQHVLDETKKQMAAGHKDPAILGKRAIARASMGDKAGAAREFDAALSTSPPPGSAQVADLLKTIAQTLGPDEALARVGSYQGPDRAVLVVDFLRLKGDYSRSDWRHGGGRSPRATNWTSSISKVKAASSPDPTPIFSSRRRIRQIPSGTRLTVPWINC